jgi:5-methylcytosine-specific restriction endonuclease McrA
MKRKPITDRMRLRSLFHHFGIVCYLCGDEIVLEDGKPLVPFDHIVEVADDGEHTPANLKPVHVACHHRKSGKSETQRSRIDRLEKAKLGLPKRSRDKHKRAWPKGRKMGSRMFRRKVA